MCSNWQLILMLSCILSVGAIDWYSAVDDTKGCRVGNFSVQMPPKQAISIIEILHCFKRGCYGFTAQNLRAWVAGWETNYRKHCTWHKSQSRAKHLLGMCHVAAMKQSENKTTIIWRENHKQQNCLEKSDFFFLFMKTHTIKTSCIKDMSHIPPTAEC